MGMFDTINPCKELQEVIIKEIQLNDFDWQTKEFESLLMIFGINKDLKVTVEHNGCYNGTINDLTDDETNQIFEGTFTGFMSGYTERGLLTLEINDSTLTSLLYSMNDKNFTGVNKEDPDKIILFKSLTDYTVMRIVDFSKMTPEVKNLRDKHLSTYW